MYMETKKSHLVILVLAVLVAALLGYMLGSASDKNGKGDRNPEAQGMHHEMNGMMAGLSGKTGDELDKAFLTEMVVHHEGAVDMAEAVLANGKHPELKAMAEAIIAAQTAEIAQMKAWSAAWYGN